MLGKCKLGMVYYIVMSLLRNFLYYCLSVLHFPDAKGILRHKRTKGRIQKVKIFELAIATPAFRLRSVCVPFAFCLRSVCVPSAFRLRSVCVPFAYRLL